MEAKRIKIKVLASIIIVLSLAIGCNSTKNTSCGFPKNDYQEIRVLGSLGIADGDTVEKIPGLVFCCPAKIIRVHWQTKYFILFMLKEKQFLCCFYEPYRIMSPLEIAEEVVYYAEGWEQGSPEMNPKPLRGFKEMIESVNGRDRINVVFKKDEYNFAFLNVIPDNSDCLIETVLNSIKIDN